MLVSYSFFFKVIGKISVCYFYFNLYSLVNSKNKIKKFVLPKSPHVFKKQKSSYVFKKRAVSRIDACFSCMSQEQLNLLLEKQICFLINCIMQNQNLDFFWVRCVQLYKKLSFYCEMEKWYLVRLMS